MSNLINGSHFRDDISSPASNDCETTLEVKESESEADNKPEPEAGNESEGLPVEKLEAGIDLVPIDNRVAVVNGSLSNCKSYKKCSLTLQLDRRVGFSSNWKLLCTS